MNMERNGGLLWNPLVKYINWDNMHDSCHAYTMSAVPYFFATRILKTHTTRRFYFTSVLGLQARL